MGQLRATLMLFDRRSSALGLAAAALTVLLIGIPTAVIPNGFFMRMTPTRPQDYLFLALTGLLAGLIVATYAVPDSATAAGPPGDEGRLTAGGFLSFLAVGCPICNKLVVLALGLGGAMRYFAPVQPFLGVAAVALLGVTAWVRLRALRERCTLCAG